MMACGPENLGSFPRFAMVHNDVIFFLGVFMIQFNIKISITAVSYFSGMELCSGRIVSGADGTGL